MKNNYSEKDEKKLIRQAIRDNVPPDLARLIYVSNLLGVIPDLVLHGGGNSSVKLSNGTFFIKGSGSDMGKVQANCFAALDLQELLRSRPKKFLPDMKEISKLKSAKIDPEDPDPSVESFFHAFLPHKYILHTHANAILALTNQKNGGKHCRRVFGNEVGILSYAMPGLDLAIKATRVYEKNKNIKGIVAMKHGLFTFGDTAKDAYIKMIRLVTLAELEIKRYSRIRLKNKLGKRNLKIAAEIAPTIRGAMGEGWLLDFKYNKEIEELFSGAHLRRFAKAQPATPDHVIWIKPRPLILPKPDLSTSFSDNVRKAVKRFEIDYQRYFDRENKRYFGKKNIRDTKPRVIIVQGVGLFGLGKDLKSARIAADLSISNIGVFLDSEKIGRYQGVSTPEIFDIEYWEPEIEKISKQTHLPLQGQIVLVTGAGSGIGSAIVDAFANQGAVVVGVDKNKNNVKKAMENKDGLALGCDVTNQSEVRRAFEDTCRAFGGVDIVVSNAGSAWQGEIGTVDHAVIRESFEVNFFAHQNIAQNAVRIMRAQRLGGRLLFNASKQAVNPGENFGPYGLPKAATLFLMRQYAVDHGKDGITSNAVNAGRVRSGLLTESMIASRSAARNQSKTDYMSGNLLGKEVMVDHVAKAFVDLALSPSTTAAVLTVDGGNISAALR